MHLKFPRMPLHFAINLNLESHAFPEEVKSLRVNNDKLILVIIHNL